MKYFWFLVLVCLLPACTHAPGEADLPIDELKQLDALLRESKEIQAKKSARIDSLSTLLNKVPQAKTLERLKMNLRIGDEYRSFCSDSSVMFYYSALILARERHPQEINEVSIKMINALAASGIFGKAEGMLALVDTLTLTPAQSLEKAKAGRQLYSYLRGYLNEDNEISPMLTQPYEFYDSLLRATLPETDRYRQFLVGEKAVKEGRNKYALTLLDRLMKNLEPTDNLYGMAAYQAAKASRQVGDERGYGRYLALSAMSDVKGAVRETMALPALAEWLYRQGDVDRAYRYINASLNDATNSDSRMRTVEIANLVPIIEESYRHKISASRDELMLYFLLVTVLCIALGGMMVFFVRNLKRANTIRKKLHAQSKMQENYIGHFLALCASYADKLESTRKLVMRKISSGQSDELLQMIKKNRTADEQSDEFFRVFDETFTDLYPDFIEKFNLLLRPEERLPVPTDGRLTTELRIYAFVRLGVGESVRIAQILRCSVSTIYTYRNRMRGRAIDREAFESQVLAIGEEE